MVGMAIKWNIEKLIDFYNKNGCALITKDYKNEDSFLTYKCKCENKDTKKFSAFKRSPYCRLCYRNNMSGKMSFTFEKVKKDFKLNGCVLLSKSYKNAWESLDYICICGRKSKIQYANFSKGVRCFGCPSKRKYTEEKMKLIMKNSNCIYISQTGINVNDRVKFICHCENKSEKSIKSFIETKRCNECSHRSFLEKVSGENSSNWNPELTDEERMHNRDFSEYEKWRNSVFERDNYTCQCCNNKGEKLNAHHKDGYHWCVDRRLDVSNGATLCEDCHKEFHSLYGVKNNSEKQFIDYIVSKTTLTL